MADTTGQADKDRRPEDRAVLLFQGSGRQQNQFVEPRPQLPLAMGDNHLDSCRISRPVSRHSSSLASVEGWDNGGMPSSQQVSREAVQQRKRCANDVRQNSLSEGRTRAWVA